MAKRNQPKGAAAPLLDELRSIDSIDSINACAPEDPVSQPADGDASLCLLRVVAGLDSPAWASLCVDHGLAHWHAVPLPCPAPRGETLAHALGRLALGAADLHTFLRTEIERSRACQVPLALALIQPDPPQPASGLLDGLLQLAQSLTRSFDHATLMEGERLALVLSGATLCEAERLVGALLRRIRTHSAGPGANHGLLCSAGLVGFGGCVELEPGEFLARAALALDNARNLGGNRLEVALPVDVGLASKDTLVHASEKHFLFFGKKAGDK